MKKRIDIILFERKLAETRSKASAMIMAGQVFVNDILVKKSGELHFFDSKIKINDLNPRWVSRGGIKLFHAIKHFNINIKNLTCLDIGASTGGFTDVLLSFKAKKIYAIDVGFNQLHEKLKFNERVINIEKTNARLLSKDYIKEEIDLIVCDASFISIKKVLNPSLAFLKKSSGILLCLIKPQFEANKNEIQKGGVIKNKSVHERIILEITTWFEKDCKMKVIGVIESSIKGPKGNTEFFIAVKN